MSGVTGSEDASNRPEITAGGGNFDAIFNFMCFSVVLGIFFLLFSCSLVQSMLCVLIFCHLCERCGVDVDENAGATGIEVDVHTGKFFWRF